MLKILLFGNLGSGKSRLAACFIKRHPGYLHVAIDEFRRSCSDGSTNGERVAKQGFINTIEPGRAQIIEATGLGDTAALLATKMRSMSDRSLVVLLTTPLELCLDRLACRTWDIPYPAPPNMAIDLARRTDAMIQDGSLERLWKDHEGSILIKGDCSDDGSMLELCERMESHLHP